METDSSVRNNKLFLYPVLICERCDWQKASYLIEDSLQFHAYLEDKNLKNNYFLYYKRLHTYIEELYNIGDASTTYEVFKNVLLIWFVRTSPNYREYYKAYFIKN